MGHSGKPGADAERRGSFIWTVAIGLCLGIGTGTLGYYLLRSQAVRLIPPVKLSAHAAPGAQPANTKGPENAPIIIEEFSDFQCPPCRDLYQRLKKIEAEYGPQIKVIYRQYPIASLHKNAWMAAEAAEAAGLQGHFWEMHDLLYANQESWARSGDAESVFTGYAHSLGLDPDRFRRDREGPRTKARIQADQQRGDSIGVPGTPVVLVNGRQVPPTAISYAGIHSAVDKELKRQASCAGICSAPPPKP